VARFDVIQSLTDKSVTPKALTRFPLILPEPDAGLRREFDRRCREAGVADRLRVAIEVGPSPTAMSYVRDAIGVGVVPRSAVNGHKDLLVRALPPKLSPANTVRVNCRKRPGTDDLDLTEAGTDFLQALRKAALAESK
jgi:DNA-binding transcriptional LysR family regulator